MYFARHCIICPCIYTFLDIALHTSAYVLWSAFEIVKGRKVGLIVLRKEQWDSNGYLEGNVWGLYPWAVKLLKKLFMQLKWETNKYAEAFNAPESTFAGVFHALHLKVHMLEYAMQSTWNYTLRYLY